MTRPQLIELIQRKMAGGDPQWDYRWSKREIGYHVDQVRDLLVKNWVLQTYYEGSERAIESSITARFENVAVLHDSPTNQYYVELPARRLPVSNDKDIVMVCTMKNQVRTFKPIPSGLTFALNGLSNMLGGYVGFKPEGGKLWLFNAPTGGFSCGLLITMLTAGEDCPDNIEYCPADLEAPILEGVRKVFAENKPEDKVNDQIDA